MAENELSQFWNIVVYNLDDFASILVLLELLILLILGLILLILGLL